MGPMSGFRQYSTSTRMHQIGNKKRWTQDTVRTGDRVVEGRCDPKRRREGCAVSRNVNGEGDGRHDQGREADHRGPVVSPESKL